jgi:ketosteroid isomerase-like protein
MSSRNIFKKSTRPWYGHGRWLLLTLLAPVVVMYMTLSHEQRRQEWVWHAPIEPPGVTIVSNASAIEAPPVGMSGVKELGKQSSAASVGGGRLNLASTRTPSDIQGLMIDEKQVRQAIGRWSAAWSSRDMAAYLNQYAKSFAPAGGQSRGDWVKSRYQRILSKQYITHQVQNLEIKVSADRAVAHFQQMYEADDKQQVGPKTLHLIREEGIWRINVESTY